MVIFKIILIIFLTFLRGLSKNVGNFQSFSVSFDGEELFLALISYLLRRGVRSCKKRIKPHHFINFYYLLQRRIAQKGIDQSSEISRNIKHHESSSSSMEIGTSCYFSIFYDLFTSPIKTVFLYSIQVSFCYILPSRIR